MVKKVPEGFATVTSSLVLNNAAAAIELYKKALGATEDYRMEMPDGGKIMHACLTIGDSKIFLGDANSEMCPASTSNFYLYIDDVDAAYKTAKSAGFESLGTGPEDMFWGDRIGGLKDKFGNRWTLATHVRDVSPADMEKGQKEFLSKMAGKKAA